MRTSLALLALCAWTACPAAPVAPYPTKPVRFIVPIAPGGSNDIVARALAQRLTARLGQSVVVDNRPGGGGITGTDIAARASPDGYTLLMVNISHAINPAADVKLPYDLLRDFAPVTLLGAAPNALVVHAQYQAASVQELVAIARKMPGRIAYASAGNASSPHLAAELFRLRSGTDMAHVPYKGSGPALVAVMGGEVQLSFPVLSTALSLVKAGRIRALAVTGVARAAALPDTPTVREAGIAEYEFAAWFGCVVPAAVPQGLVAVLNREMRAILSSDDFRAQFAAQGMDVSGTTPADFAFHLRREIERWRGVVRATGIAIH